MCLAHTQISTPEQLTDKEKKFPCRSKPLNLVFRSNMNFILTHSLDKTAHRALGTFLKKETTHVTKYGMYWLAVSI